MIIVKGGTLGHQTSEAELYPAAECAEGDGNPAAAARRVHPYGRHHYRFGISYRYPYF